MFVLLQHVSYSADLVPTESRLLNVADFCIKLKVITLRHMRFFPKCTVFFVRLANFWDLSRGYNSLDIFIHIFLLNIKIK